MKKIVIIGGGGHAKVIISILKRIDKYDIIGYTDPEDRGKILGIKYVGNDDKLKYYYEAKNVKNAVIGIGQLKNSELRHNIVKLLFEIGFSLPAIVAPTAIVNEDVIIEDGTVVMDGVVINSGTRIGKYSIINTRVSVDHDCQIGDFTHIAPGVTISGGVVIGRDVLVCAGSTIIQYKKIVDDTVIGAGASVMESITTTGVYIGNPARPIRE